MARKVEADVQTNAPLSAVEEGPLACTEAQLPVALQDYQLFNPEAMAAFHDNLGGEPISMTDLVRIKVPSGGGTTWEVPTVEGDDELVKEIQGIIIFSKMTRAYWVDEFTGAKNPPDCSSDDGIIGRGDPGGLCVNCPMAQWESSPKGDGNQACKKVQLLFVMVPGNVLPYLIPVPPGSLKNVRKYMVGLSGKGISYSQCVTSFKLTKADSKKGITYSQIVPAIVDRIPTQLVGQVKSFIDQNRGSFAAAKISVNDVAD